MQALKLNVLAVVTSMASGCASITTSDTQSVMVTTRLQDGKAIEDAECKLSNDKGNWTVVSPGSIGVRRTADDMQIECSKNDTPKGLAKAISRAHGGMFGNIIFGGGIGAIIDHSSGNGYDYSDVIEVVMGASIVIDRYQQQAGAKRSAADGNSSREAEMKRAGYELAQEHDFLRNQYFLVFRPIAS